MPATFHLDPPPGFRGLNPYRPVEIYNRHLPHWRQEGATYFVTFRLNDSLPLAKLKELREIRKRWQGEIDSKELAGELSEADKKEAWEKLARITFEKAEGWLDQGMGSCLLRALETRIKLADSIHFFDDKRYELGSYAIMPNHVHMIIRPLMNFDLKSILQSRKNGSARQINKLNQRSGPLWQEESFDRIIRDAEHLWRCLQYIGKNPRKAGLNENEFTLWTRPEWQKLGWTFHNEE